MNLTIALSTVSHGWGISRNSWPTRDGRRSWYLTVNAGPFWMQLDNE